jgi:hypothetical protein
MATFSVDVRLGLTVCLKGRYVQSIHECAMKGHVMASRHPQPGLDGRHRDTDGEISRKHGNAEIGGLRQIYGPDFAEGRRADMKLSTLLKESGAPSLSQYLKRTR